MQFGDGWQQDCRVCCAGTAAASKARAEWGCDVDAPTPQFELPCDECGGRLDECAACGGSGRLQFHRCPNSFVLPEHLAACRALRMTELGMLPGPGGWADQPGTLVDAIQLLRPLAAAHEEAARQRRGKSR
jgi:hypothetical protein